MKRTTGANRSAERSGNKNTIASDSGWRGEEEEEDEEEEEEDGLTK